MILMNAAMPIRKLSGNPGNPIKKASLLHILTRYRWYQQHNQRNIYIFAYLKGIFLLWNLKNY